MFERDNIWYHLSDLKNSFGIDSLILEEGFRLYNITLRHLGAEQKEGEAKAKEHRRRPKPVSRLQ